MLSRLESDEKILAWFRGMPAGSWTTPNAAFKALKLETGLSYVQLHADIKRLVSMGLLMAKKEPAIETSSHQHKLRGWRWLYAAAAP